MVRVCWCYVLAQVFHAHQPYTPIHPPLGHHTTPSFTQHMPPTTPPHQPPLCALQMLDVALGVSSCASPHSTQTSSCWVCAPVGCGVDVQLVCAVACVHRNITLASLHHPTPHHTTLAHHPCTPPPTTQAWRFVTKWPSMCMIAAVPCVPNTLASTTTSAACAPTP